MGFGNYILNSITNRLYDYVNVKIIKDNKKNPEKSGFLKFILKYTR